MDLTPFLSTFAIIAIAELGDKTQLTVVTLCSKHRPEIIFLSSFLALLGIGGVSILIGSAITQFLPMSWIKIGSGAVFIIFGIHTLIGEEEESYSCGETTFFASFSLVALMELGDKTQLATIALAAKFASPYLVFSGLGLAFFLITGAGVIIGAKLKDFVSRKYIRIGSSIIFITFGLIFILGAISGISIF
ncbi:hypothetical protein AKJ41_01355 [candidate division MSBL1 archaeon SCGC-AAA259O05]|uniref:TMEM165/GDT1 family protein n=1 Tax=candidate division MSBL1 archaeon SCGC-AAA259O05 TaxID=1698271 RepID=A0A133V512_9EURY|nr:hypothetical protein AKJ41_01355 [candidate division MSBL1 archaeon SCGC-AAA259O05]